MADTSHGSTDMSGMAGSATLHCLTGCALGEIGGLLLATGLGLATAYSIGISIGLAFVLGFSLSSLPLLAAGLDLGAALRIVAAADTLSIATMEIVDNLVVAVVPSALTAGLANPTFWWSMALGLVLAYLAAYPVNRALLARGRGHALSHAYTDAPRRRRIPDIPSPVLAGIIAAFILGGLLASLAS